MDDIEERVDRAHRQALEAQSTMKASWQEDGKGLVGDAVPIRNMRAQLTWESKIVSRRAQLDVTSD